MCTPEGRASLLRGQPTPEMALADAIRVLKASLMAQGGGGDQVREGGATRWEEEGGASIDPRICPSPCLT